MVPPAQRGRWGDMGRAEHGGEQHPKLLAAPSGFPGAVLSGWGQTEWDEGPWAHWVMDFHQHCGFREGRCWGSPMEQGMPKPQPGFQSSPLVPVLATLPLLCGPVWVPKGLDACRGAPLDVPVFWRLPGQDHPRAPTKSSSVRGARPSRPSSSSPHPPVEQDPRLFSREPFSEVQGRRKKKNGREKKKKETQPL